MTDPNRPSDDVVKPAQTGEPVVSKPYIMPDDPEEGSNEALTKELAETRDKMLRTLAEMENLRQRAQHLVARFGQFLGQRLIRPFLGIVGHDVGF